MSDPYVLAGVDLAWRPERNPTAIAVGTVDGKTLRVQRVTSGLLGLASVLDVVDSTKNLRGIAVDAPLIINNQHGKRDCETALSRVYAKRKAGCHSANLSLYPNAAPVAFSQALLARGFMHAAAPTQRWQIECYPHPAIIELFNLPERLAYKKGRVHEKRAGQATLATWIRSQQKSRCLRCTFDRTTLPVLDVTRIAALRGKALKCNEDALDAIITLIIAAHYALGTNSTTFGTIETGYIYVPQPGG